DVSRQEGNSGTTAFVFTVSLSAAYDQSVTVQYATANGTATVADRDYLSQKGTLTFAPGATTKTISITVYGDTKTESDETFFINLSGPSSNAAILDSQGLGTILNDDGGSTFGTRHTSVLTSHADSAAAVLGEELLSPRATPNLAGPPSAAGA